MTQPGRQAGAGRLVLCGAGHAHLAVLRDLADRRLEDAIAVLVAPETRPLYSGMVPAVLAGLLPGDRATIDVGALARRAGVELVEDRVVDVDPGGRRVRTGQGHEFEWRSCSLDVGSEGRAVPGLPADPAVVSVRPLSALVRRVEEFAASADSGQVDPCVVVVGGGAAGIELALALRTRLRDLAGARVLLVERGSGVLPAGSRAGRRLVERELARAGIAVATYRRAIGLDDGFLVADGERWGRPSLVLLATGGAPPAFLRAGPLAVDPDGHLLVDRFLRSTSHPAVSGAGDCIALEGHPGHPRSGVAAVRQGAVLAHNLRAAQGATAGSLRPWTPRATELALLSTGDGRAIALRGRFASVGRGWGWLKRRIDRTYVESFHGRSGRLRRRAPDLTASRDEG